MNLPSSSKLPIHHLSAIFNKTSTSYKFYWFYAILQIIKQNKKITSKNELIATMLANVWYSVHFYKLSFGKQDKLAEIVKAISESKDPMLNISYNENEQIIITQILQYLEGDKRTKLKKKILSLGDYVPYRFIRPWCETKLTKGLKNAKLNREIETIASNHHKILKIPYVFSAKGIVLNDLWFDYFKTHLKIVEDFCLWNLLKYLQKRNPNVPNIAGKLFPPNKKERSLTKERKYWQEIYKNVPLRCIFSNEEIDFKHYALDHFIPWSFVTHNQLWNLVPIVPSVNSQKSNNLPDLMTYFPKFGKIQYQVFKKGLELKKNKLLEDYLGTLGNSYEEINSLSENDFILRLNNQIKPLAQIAQNMGFQGGWIYQK